jgi:hypothetical protein
MGPRPLVVCMALWLAGCGSAERSFESTAAYEAPVEHHIVVETVVDLPFEATWDAMIRRLSESSFRVATLEKASRFVDVHLDLSSALATAATRPGRYVDCGRTLRTFSDGESEERFDYAVVESSRHRVSVAGDDGYRVSDVDRRVGLEARASIYLQPEGGNRTRITVNARYTVEIEISGTLVLFPTDLDAKPSEARSFGPRVESIQFTTFDPGRDDRRGGLVCRSTGAFEHSLAALANPGAAL